MGLRRIVPDGANAAGFVRQRPDVADPAVAGAAHRRGLGGRRGQQSARASFRAHLFHAQGRGRAVELRVFSRRRPRVARVAGGRAAGHPAGRCHGL